MQWTILENELPHGQNENYLSTIFSIGNGRLSTRGTLSEEGLEAYRATYLSGLYTKAGFGLIYPMAAPEWLGARILGSDNHPASVFESRRSLDMQHGLLTREALLKCDGSSARLIEERFASFENQHLVCQRITIEAIDCPSPFSVELSLDGDVRNSRAKYYKPGQFPNCDSHGLKLSKIKDIDAADGILSVSLISPQTGLHACARAQVRQSGSGSVHCSYDTSDGKASARYQIKGLSSSGDKITFEKMCVITGDNGSEAPPPQAVASVARQSRGTEERRDSAARDVMLSAHRAEFPFPKRHRHTTGVLGEAYYAENALRDIEPFFTAVKHLDYDAARALHLDAIGRFWNIADVQIEGDANAQRAVRFAIWSTRIASPADNGSSSIGAKNLTGDWYRGAVFWDMEMFQLPLLCAVEPDRARNHILYRTHRLGAARTLAHQDGYEGVRFPWQSYRTGLEEPPVLGGFLYQQQHINAAVAWGLLHYDSFTHDTEFLFSSGLELLIELCRFWASRVTGPDQHGFYHIEKVCGPDEVHQGVNDNCYTNLMVATVLERTEKIIGELEIHDRRRLMAILENAQVNEPERSRWSSIARKLHVPLLPDGTYAQFEGFGEMPAPDERLIAEAGAGKDATNKQADTLLLFQAIPEKVPQDMLLPCWNKYAPLCTQTSSLSLCTHALLATRIGKARDAYRYFSAACGIDLEDIMGNTEHGIHGAGEGGIWLAAVHGFGGLRADDGRISIEPRILPQWVSMRYRFLTQGQLVAVTIEQERLCVANHGTRPVAVTVCQRAVMLQPGAPYIADHKSDWIDQELHAVIFDLDGVLVTTDNFHYLAWKELADKLGLQFDEKVNHRLRGVSREGSLRIIYEHNGKPVPEPAIFNAQCAEKNTCYVQLIGQMTEKDILPGALDLLQELRRKGIRTAIASASKNSPLVLERTGLIHHIDAISDGNNITASKPDPQVFFIAAQRAGALPWNCIGIEDAAAGIESIHRAGMVAVGIGDQTDAAEFRAASVRELSVKILKDIFITYDNKTDPYRERNIAKMKSEMA